MDSRLSITSSSVIAALGVREPNVANKVHYHLLIKVAAATKRDLEKAIEEAMPDRHQVKRRKKVLAHRQRMALCPPPSETKAKIAGWIKGRKVEDAYAWKRLLFKSNLGLKKYGVIGQFWELRKKKLWSEIRAKGARYSRGIGNAERERNWPSTCTPCSVKQCPLNGSNDHLGHGAKTTACSRVDRLTFINAKTSLDADCF